jgi:2-polyprenyl-3-methyl-5-hydroxy-6-metoxy-1,4-benzoquinol methylase
MVEIDLMEKYPRTKRNLDERADQKTDEDKKIAKQYGKEFFDGERRHGYGGFNYNARFWTEVVKDFIKHYKLTNKSKLLDVGCAKGFMMHDFKLALPGMTVKGIDISKYAIETAMEDMKPFVSVADAKDLSMFKDKEFDLVISVNTVHNLKRPECIQAIREIQRVGKHGFIVVDAWRDAEEEKKMKMWNLTAETFMHVDDWKKLFNEAGYTGDYYWFIP